MKPFCVAENEKKGEKEDQIDTIILFLIWLLIWHSKTSLLLIILAEKNLQNS